MSSTSSMAGMITSTQMSLTSAQATTATATTRTYAPSDTTSIVSPAQTTVNNTHCDRSLLTIPIAQPAFGIYATNKTLSLMQSCCHAAPVISYNDGCGLFCQAENQTVADLYSCVWGHLGDGSVNAGYNSSAYVAGWIDNVPTQSFSTLLPVETDTRCWAGATATAGSDACPYRSVGERSSRLSTPGFSFAGLSIVVLLVSGGLGGLLL